MDSQSQFLCLIASTKSWKLEYGSISISSQSTYSHIIVGISKRRTAQRLGLCLVIIRKALSCSGKYTVGNLEYVA